jgi:YidC/Oxa1 family membrane protein insertase
MNDNRNVILAIALSVLILIGFQYVSDMLYPKPLPPAVPPPAPGAEVAPQVPSLPSAAVPPPPAAGVAPGPGVSLPSPVAVAPPAAQVAETRERVLAASPRVRIATPRLHGSIALTGGRLDDLTLADYREAIAPDSPEIVLLSPAGAQNAYFVQVGWVDAGGRGGLPDADTLWSADHDTLTPEQPVTLTWTSPAGVAFSRTFAVDRDYMFTITEAVDNRSETPLRLSPYALVSRYGTPPTSGFYILHEGPLGVFDGTLDEISYKDLDKSGTVQKKSVGGWAGITDKYWLTAVVPGASAAVSARFLHERPGNQDRYQVDLVGQPMAVEPGAGAQASSRVFAGAKEVRLLDRYMEAYSIDRFDRAIDFGWFYFLTKPLFLFLIYIKEAVGNLGIAILLLTVLIKALFFPLANKSYAAMNKMRKLQPEIARLKERLGDDKMRFNQEMMALYKREKVNPASGCLPMLIQIPVFFALYKVLFVTIEMRHAPFFGWIRDLSAPDPTSVWNLFGLISWDPATVIPSVVNLGAWPLIMGITMWLQQKLNPQPPDPIQAKMFMLLPVVFTFLLAHFPAGLVIYWAWNNVLSIAQQWAIMRRAGNRK